MVGWLAATHLYRGRWPRPPAPPPPSLARRTPTEWPLGCPARARPAPGATGRRHRFAAARRGARVGTVDGRVPAHRAGPRRPRRGRLAGRRRGGHLRRGRGGLPDRRPEAAYLGGRRVGLLALAGRRRRLAAGLDRGPFLAPDRRRLAGRRGRVGAAGLPVRAGARAGRRRRRGSGAGAGDLRPPRRPAGGGRGCGARCGPAARRASRAARGRPHAPTGSA